MNLSSLWGRLSVSTCLISLFFSGNSPLQAGEETRLFYIRHGEVPGNDPNPLTYVYTGCRTDDSLTERGVLQAKLCAERVERLQESGVIGKVAAIYSSTLKRAVETASSVAERLGMQVQQRSLLQEIDWGVADGKLVQEMREQWGALEKETKRQLPDRKTQWDYLPVFPGAETYNALLHRSVGELAAIAEAHPGESVIVVGHGRVLKTLIAEAKNSEENLPYPANCGIAEFTYSPENGLRFERVIEESP